VGACVGMKGARIHGIVRELRNENIDVINFTSNEQLFIQRALSPAKITSIDLRETNKKARVYLKADQVSLAIGKNGLNIKLASRLTGYDIDVFREDEVDEDDVELDEFSDEIEQWILDELKEIGLDTAKSVLRLSIDDIERRTDLDRETIVDVVEVLKQEFEEEISVEDKVIEQSPISAEPDATEASSIEATIDQPNTEEKEEEA